MGKSKNIDELATALAKAQGECHGIKKSGKNPFLKNEYATLDDIINGIRTPLAANGLAYSQLLKGQNGAVKLTTLLMHSSGQWISSSVVVGSGGQEKGINAIQSLGKSITYMKRYALSAMLGVASEVDDDGNGAGPPSQKQQPQKPRPQNQTGKPTRPMQPETLRPGMQNKAGWWKLDDGYKRAVDGEPITEKQVGKVAGDLGRLLPQWSGDQLNKARYDIMGYLYGVRSTHDLSKKEATALIDWAEDTENAGKEAAMIIDLLAQEAGQQELFTE